MIPIIKMLINMMMMKMLINMLMMMMMMMERRMKNRLINMLMMILMMMMMMVMEERTGDRLKFMTVAAILLQFINISGNGERRSKARQSFWMRGQAASFQI